MVRETVHKGHFHEALQDTGVVLKSLKKEKRNGRLLYSFLKNFDWGRNVRLKREVENRNT